MKTYSVKQIAELLKTNPETIRRWIRDNKLHAVQESKKGGNIITEDELRRFLQESPKYLERIPTSKGAELAMLPAIVSVMPVFPLAAGAVLTTLLAVSKGKKGAEQAEIRLSAKEIRKMLHDKIEETQEAIQYKQELILQTKAEIEALSEQMEQYEYLLANEETWSDAIEKEHTNRRR